MDEFLSVFGSIPLSQVVIILIAIGFGVGVYKQVKKYFHNKYEEESKQKEDMQKVLDQVAQYPKYRQQSIEMQQYFQNEINKLQEAQKQTYETQEEIRFIVKRMEEDLREREKNKLQDKLLQYYRYYTDEKKNPKKSWTRMESQAFWALFKDYENVGGDGYMHSVVQPAMNLLTIIENE